MGQSKRQFTSVAAIGLALACASQARADVTPADVWDQWAGYLSSFGYTVEVQPELRGNDILFPSFEMTMFIPSDDDRGIQGGTVVFKMGALDLIDQGDGTVSIEMPETSMIEVLGDGPADQDFEARLNLVMAGHRTIASGQPGDITYDYVADRIAVSLADMSGRAEQMPTLGTISLSLEGAQGQTGIASENGTSRIQQSMQVARMAYDIELQDIDPGAPGKMSWKGDLTNLSTTSVGVVPPEVNPLALDEALKNGYLADTLVEFDGGSGDVYILDDRDEMRVQSTSSGGMLKLSVSDAGLTYDVLSEGIDLSIAGSQIPFPLTTTAAAMGVGFTIPVSSGDDEQPFSIGLTLTDLEVPDMLWMMADPTNGLPHDPITVELELDGSTRLFVDIMNEQQMKQLDQTGGVPGELTQLSLSHLRIAAAGAVAEATADFDIDNSQVFPLNPELPAFGGAANIQLTGVTTLLGKLGQMGLIPMQQVMIGSGMIQQLGRPGDGPDDYSATIDVTPEGALTINGMPLPLQ